MDLRALGITGGSFGGNVTVTGLGAGTLGTIGANSIFLIGVDGTGTNIITQQDFILA